MEPKNNNTPNRQNGDHLDQVNDSSSAGKQSSASPSVSGIHVQWSDQSKRVTQMAGLAYFVQFLETTELFEQFVESCPLSYKSNNAPDRRAVLGTILLSVQKRLAVGFRDASSSFTKVFFKYPGFWMSMLRSSRYMASNREL